jgi:hypothetical protein
MTGLRVRSGAAVDAVALECSDGTRTPLAGGPGGASDRTFRCPEAFPSAAGIRGGHGAFVDRIGLSCDTRLGPALPGAPPADLPE